MIGKKAFVDLCNWVNKVEKRNDDDNEVFERLFNKGFNNEENCFDTHMMYVWPFEAAQEILKIVVLDMGETEEGADWFIYEGMPQILNYGSTEINDTTISSYEEYYDWVVKEYSNGDGK